MLTNQDRREILNQVKTSGSQDIIAALRGQMPSAPEQSSMPASDPVTIPESPQPIDVNLEPRPSLPSNLVDSTTSEPTQLAKNGGEYIPKFPRPEGLPEAPPTGTISQAKEKNIADKILNVLANPLATFGRSVRGEDINPGNIRRGENPFDAFVLGMVNPASWVESGQYAVKEAKQGNYLAAGLNALGVLPIVPAGIKGIKNIKNITKTSKPIRGTGLVKATHTPKTPKDVYTPSPAESSKIKVIKDENIKYLKSDEYMSKRMANTGESKESILSQIDDYIKELDETPITFRSADDMGESTIGFYKSGNIFDETSSQIGIQAPKGPYKSIDKNLFGTIDHEIKHLLSPTQKLDKTSSTYKLWTSAEFKAGRKKYQQAIDDINDKFMKATSKEEADKILSMYDKIPNKELFDGTFTNKIPNMDKIYKNYPTLKIDKSVGKEFGEYLGRAQEQQPRLVRGAQWVKQNFNWDGTKSGMTDDMLDNIFNQMQNSKNLGGKTSIPEDFRTLLENSTITKVDDYGLVPKTSYSKLKNVLSKAWATIPVGLGLKEADKKAMGGFDDFPNMVGNERAPFELKRGIRRVESSDGIDMMNPESSATGLYGQLYNEVKDLPILKNTTREQFAADTTLQNKIFDMRYRGEIPGVPGLKDNAEYLSKKYADVIGDLSFNEIAAISNLTGREGARRYFASLRDGTEFKLPGTNKTPEEYIKIYRSAFGK
jgi:hypothetical protein